MKNANESKVESKYYMHIVTMAIDTYEGWWYENKDGEKVNAVDLGETVEVVKDEKGLYWLEM
jgi:hypothetical protein